MATTTAAASGVTAPDDWTLTAGASKVVAVAQPDDDATSYISSGATINTVQTFTVTPSLSTGDTVTQIDIDIRAKRGGASNGAFVVGYAFTPNGGGSQTGTSGTLTSLVGWGDFAYQHAGLSAVWGSGLTIFCQNTQARDVQISTMDITITYTPGATTSIPVMMASRRRRL